MKLWRLIISFYETVDNNLQHELTNEVLRVEFKLENMYQLWIFKVRNNFKYCKSIFLPVWNMSWIKSILFIPSAHPFENNSKEWCSSDKFKREFCTPSQANRVFFWHGSACKDDERTSGIWFGMAISNSCHTFHELECKNLFGQ